MFPFADRGPAALHSNVADFFMPWINAQEHTYIFHYKINTGVSHFEYWSGSGNRVPCGTGIWMVEHGSPAQARHLFLAHSAADILCFCHFSPDWLVTSGQVAFAALGICVTSNQVSFLKARFLNARIHTLFDVEIAGKVTDCKTALWLAGKDAQFLAEGDLLKVRYRRTDFNIPASAISLSRFEKATGLRSGIRTHKPKEGFDSYYSFYLNTL